MTRIVAYYTKWSKKKSGIGKFTNDQIDPKLITHIIYAFTSLNLDTLKMETTDEEREEIDELVKLKDQGIKVMIAIGGWGDSKTFKYSRLVGNSSARTEFVADVVEFLKQHKLDGLDIDWEYPTKPQGTRGNPMDKENFPLLLNELKAAFQPFGFILTAAVSSKKPMVDSAYEVKSMANSLDWINLMTYNFHGAWNGMTGLNAPLNQQPGDKEVLNVKFAVNYWIQCGMPAEKIVVGIPMFGKSFTLENAENHGIGDITTGPGVGGEITKNPGSLAFYEVQDRIKNQNWTVVTSSDGCYAFHGDQWVSYDDVESVKEKAIYIKNQNLGGAMVWSMDQDDTGGNFHEQKFALLSTIKTNLLQ